RNPVDRLRQVETARSPSSTGMWFFPLDQSASLTLRVFVAILITAGIFVIGGVLRRRWRWAALGSAVLIFTSLAWIGLYCSRPAWMRYALDDNAPTPHTSPLTWATRDDGLETAEVAVSVDGHWVDQVVLARVDPARYRFEVRWDGAHPRTIDEWQAHLGAEV